MDVMMGFLWSCVSPEMPKQKMSYPSVGQSPLQQESGEVTVEVGLILQDLDQLD